MMMDPATFGLTTVTAPFGSVTMTPVVANSTVVTAPVSRLVRVATGLASMEVSG